MGVKFNLYEENGVKEYWIVEPAENSIFVYTLQNGKYIGLKPCIEGEKITSPFFSGLDFEIQKIFVDNYPSFSNIFFNCPINSSLSLRRASNNDSILSDLSLLS